VTTRLSRDADVRRAMRSGRQRAGRLLSLHVVPTSAEAAATGPAPSRLAFVASRRVGDAVRRNRAKRLLRAAAREQVWRPALDIVLVARTAAAESDVHAVGAELVELGQRLDALVTTGARSEAAPASLPASAPASPDRPGADR